MALENISRRKALQKLGLEERASAAEIKSAYRRLAVQYHPDKNPDNLDTAKERFIDITSAYDTLTSSAGADLQEMGLRGPEAFTSRLSRWAREIGGDPAIRKEEQIRERNKRAEEYKEKIRKENEEQDRKWEERYKREHPEIKQTAPPKPGTRRFMNLDELDQMVLGQTRIKPTTTDPHPPTKKGYQEWEIYTPPAKTKPTRPKPETELSTEERIRHYYKQAEDWVLKETGSGLTLDVIVGRIVGKHKVVDEEISDRVAQAVVYTKRVLYHEVKTIPKEEVAETSRTIAQAKSIDQLLISGSAVQMILSEWDLGRNTFLIADDNRDYIQPRRYGLFFKSTYQALLPHCQSQEDIPKLAKLIDAARLYEHSQNTFQENAEEIANLIATAATGVTLEFAAEVLRKTRGCMKGHYMMSTIDPPKKCVSRQYQQVKDSLDSIKARGYNKEETLEVLNLVERIQGYGETHFGVRSLKQVADFINNIGEIVPRDKLAVAHRFVEPLSVGGWGYSQDHVETVVGAWRNIIQDILPFYESIDERKTSLFNQSMTSLGQLQGREYFKKGMEFEFSWTKEIRPTIEAAAYGGKLIVEEALRSPDPKKVIEELGRFLREYRFSEFFPLKREKDWIPFSPTPKQREAYTYLSQLQNKHNGAPLKLSPDQLGKVIEIYFK